jgi:hypothetical protein
MRVIKFRNAVVRFEDSPEIQNLVFEKLINSYFFKAGSFSGECIMQSDKAQEEAPVVLAEIADDILKFDVQYPDEE